MTFPKWFWPVILSTATTLMILLLILPLTKMIVPGFGGGWNPHHQLKAAHGLPLYGEPPAWAANNYPPLSFHIVGLASRITGNVHQTGRWLALLSLGAVAMLCGVIVHHRTGSPPLAVFTGISLIIWIAVYESGRIGMNDPQLFGSAFSLLGFYIYIRGSRQWPMIVLSAVLFTLSMFTKHNLLAFPSAVGLHLLVERRWKTLGLWISTGAVGTAILIGVTQWLDGPYFLEHLLMPRDLIAVLTRATEYLIFFQASLAMVAVWCLRRRDHSPNLVFSLAVATAHLVAAAFVGGFGVTRNIFLDCIFILVIVSALIFHEGAGWVAQWKPRSLLLAALLISPALGVIISVPKELRGDWLEARSLRDRSSDFEQSVQILRGRPGPALCEDLLVCFEAGKPLLFDPFYTRAMVRVGRLREEDLLRPLEKHLFKTVQLDIDPANLAPREHALFSAKFMQVLLMNYRVETPLSHSVILVPND